jgi:hypothetical protein
MRSRSEAGAEGAVRRDASEGRDAAETSDEVMLGRRRERVARGTNAGAGAATTVREAKRAVRRRRGMVVAVCGV